MNKKEWLIFIEFKIKELGMLILVPLALYLYHPIAEEIAKNGHYHFESIECGCGDMGYELADLLGAYLGTFMICIFLFFIVVVGYGFVSWNIRNSKKLLKIREKFPNRKIKIGLWGRIYRD